MIPSEVRAVTETGRAVFSVAVVRQQDSPTYIKTGETETSLAGG